MTTGTTRRGDSFRWAVMKIQIISCPGSSSQGTSVFLISPNSEKILFFFCKVKYWKISAHRLRGTQTVEGAVLSQIKAVRSCRVFHRSGRAADLARKAQCQRVRTAWCGAGSSVPGGAATSGAARRLIRDDWKSSIPSMRACVCRRSSPTLIRKQFLYLGVSPKARAAALADTDC